MTKNIIACCLFVNLFFAQDSLYLFRESLDFSVYRIEEIIIRNTIDLYNSKEKKQLILKFMNYDNFGKLMVDFNESDRPFRAAMSSISPTDERKKIYEFSLIYLPSKETLISLKNNPNLKNKSRLKVGYEKNTLYETTAKKMDLNLFQLIPYEDMNDLVNDLNVKKVDLMILDNIYVWNNNQYAIYSEIDNPVGDGLAIVYPKNSNLKHRLDPYLKYFLESKKFYNELSKSFGKEVADYFKKQMFTKSNE